ncbi:LLM class flavin-dependent oxidoreductase [Asanoa sp. WMMD1127]|uniref:LLM class flavin-dependent oxidoreductase n=1 Tax=Asanoa sp. WMMD1127 TaxID=3016107 RepID=UPI0024167F5C|nr:LLM class flavin-dependent oxidoreductase [Asanoa sp. WMMD1127]MDG4821477.1 LLM class flavin-dependent oxidoreductase [Asanoa sp. WMMD1127]
MKIGIGLPNTVPGTPGATLVAWARRAEEKGFAGLATIDRVAYPNHDSLTALAAAAAVTERIGLYTNILLGSLYPAALLAKTAATVDQVSGGRLTLGLAPGNREDDFEAVERPFSRRGREFDRTLDRIHRIWSGDPAHAPAPVNGGAIPVIIGGGSDAAFRRLVRWGAGGAIGGAPPAQAAEYAARVRGAWQEAGRPGEPRITALAYYSLGADAEEPSRAYLRDYYGFMGDNAEWVAANALRTPEAIREAVDGFAAAGVTELYLDPTVATLDQVDRLAEVVTP